MTSTGKRSRANPGDGGRLREELLAAAEDLLAGSGEDAVTLRAVATRAGVTTPSVYRHFRDKATLLDEVAAHTYDKLEAHARADAALASDPFEALRLRGRAYITFALAHPVHYGLLMMRRGDAGPVALEAAQQALANLTDGVRACAEAGVFCGDPVELALSLWAAVHGCVSLLISQPQFPWPEDIDAYIDRTIRMAGMGIALSSRFSTPMTSGSEAFAGAADALATQLTQKDPR